MLDTALLLDEIRRNGYTQEEIAECLGITRKTFYTRLKKKDFLLSEVEILLKKLTFSVNPMDIFFSDLVVEKPEWADSSYRSVRNIHRK